ncbi:hypothetical protein CGRA01v4_09234 [Colletotrichum graminicola]|nr:hypothetical protein CGRA01v4_09234 [Colletotrichum graminicola]
MVFQLQQIPRPTRPIIATTQTPMPYLRVLRGWDCGGTGLTVPSLCDHPISTLARPDLIQRRLEKGVPEV